LTQCQSTLCQIRQRGSSQDIAEDRHPYLDSQHSCYTKVGGSEKDFAYLPPLEPPTITFCLGRVARFALRALVAALPLPAASFPGDIKGTVSLLALHPLNVKCHSKIISCIQLFAVENLLKEVGDVEGVIHP
jgi:hypothetical protein